MNNTYVVLLVEGDEVVVKGDSFWIEPEKSVVWFGRDSGDELITTGMFRLKHVVGVSLVEPE